jgi:hypothetical protein
MRRRVVRRWSVVRSPRVPSCAAVGVDAAHRNCERLLLGSPAVPMSFHSGSTCDGTALAGVGQYLSSETGSLPRVKIVTTLLVATV